MKNQLDKVFIYIILVCIFFLSLSVIGGGYYSEKFRVYVSFGDFNGVVGGIGAAFSFAAILSMLYSDFIKRN